MTDPDRIVRIRVDLVDTDPHVWRMVDIPITTTLRGLHEIIQVAMPFENRHLYEFRIGDGRFGSPDPEGGLPIRDAKNVRLARFLADSVSSFTYIYDYGDNWEHVITIDSVSDAEVGSAYPRFIDGGGRAPPEDVGGIPGFEEFLRTMAHPRSRDHTRMVEWYGGPFNPALVDVPTITTKLEKLARRRTLGKAAGARSRAGEA